MLKKTIRRLGALAMVLAMAVSVFAVSASAVEGDETTPTATTPTITKKISKEADVYLPTATFTFKAEAAGHSDDTKYDTPTAEKALKASKDGVLGTITSSPADSDLGQETVTVGTLEIQVDKTAFAGPGTYYYDITETAGDYNGMKYDSTTKTLIVMIGTNGNVLYYGFINSKNDTTKASGDFTNIYKDNGDHKGPHDLVIKKEVGGNAYTPGMPYEFKVTITNANNVEEKYQAIIKDANGTVKSTQTFTSGTAGNTFSLEKDWTITITGLSPQDTYVVSEKNYTGDDYKYAAPTATGSITSLTLNTAKTMFESATTTMGNADTSATVTNKKDLTTPGGVIMTIAPYALMVVLAGAFAVVFLSRRNRAE